MCLAFLAKHRVPPSALISKRHCPPEALIHTHKSDRMIIRSVNGLPIVGEEKMAKCKQQLATSHATETACTTTADGFTVAWVTDPLRFVHIVARYSTWLAIGGDSGGDGEEKSTVFGITYDVWHEDRNTYQQQFTPLLVYMGTDKYDDMRRLLPTAITPFVGASASHANIFSVLQHLIETWQQSFLNGDWKFLSMILAHKGAASNYPCPICSVSSDQLLRQAPLRSARNCPATYSRDPLLQVNPSHIVPLPLHLYLGINNRIISEVFTELFGQQKMDEEVKNIKTKHTPGHGGLADLYALNGPEIKRWIKKEPQTKLANEAEVSPDVKRKVRLVTSWMKILHQRLLHDKDWTTVDVWALRACVKSIHMHWIETTRSKVFPKLHMLHHAVEFAEKFGILGRVGESRLESFHYTFKLLFNHHHRNSTDTPSERLRRSLADVALKTIKPFVDKAAKNISDADAPTRRLRSSSHVA